MKYILLLTIPIFYCFEGFSQSKAKQEAGISVGGLVINNEPSITSGLFYRYTFNNYKLRILLTMDGNINSKNRTGYNRQSSIFSGFSSDTAIKFKPGKQIKSGFSIGIQHDNMISDSKFAYYYGVDFISLKNNYNETGSGKLVISNGGFDTIGQSGTIAVNNTYIYKIYGAALPLGIKFDLSKSLFVCLESRLTGYRYKSHLDNTTITTTIIDSQESIAKLGGIENNQGFTFKLNPISLLGIGIKF